MTNINWQNYNYYDYLNFKNIEINNLPEKVKISTMCASCKLNTEINNINIEKYMELNINDILCVKVNKERTRTLIPKEKKNRRLTKDIPVKEDNHFYNQITLIIRIGSGNEPIIDWRKEPKINLKIFKNGSVQMSGCKSIESINIVLNKLIFRLKEIVANFDEKNKLVEKPFIVDPNKITITGFKVDMINSNYQVNMQIDRAKLYNLLLKKKIKSSFEPCIRACVIIKYMPIENNIEEKEISIFIFQKGNIIITGARTKNHILSAYKYINKILTDHYDEIYKKNEKEEEDLIFGTYNSILKDINLGLISNI